MLKVIKSKKFMLMQFLGCASLYVALFGDFSLSSAGWFLAVPLALFLVAVNFKAIKASGRLENVNKPWELAVVICFLVVLYFPLIGYGAIYVIHEVVGDKKYMVADAGVRVTRGVGGRLCGKEIILKYPGRSGGRAHCVSSRLYNDYFSSESADPLIPVIIKDSFFGQSLVSFGLIK